VANAPQSPVITPHHRKSVGDLDDQQLGWLRQAWNAVLPISDERGYNYHAGIHGLPLPMYCRHGSPLFLPWHRAYLYFFELALQDQVATVSLPWWDWTSDQSHATGIPDSYAVAQVNGGANPLAGASFPPLVREQAARSLGESPAATSRQPGSPGDLPTAAEIQDVLTAPNFQDFSNRLEDFHNRVHVWVGGTMAEIPLAAYDPIFWAHHCMIDRLWRIWQLQNREPNMDPSLLRQALPPFSLTVQQTLDVSTLGYDYAVATAHEIVGESSWLSGASSPSLSPSTSGETPGSSGPT